MDMSIKTGNLYFKSKRTSLIILAVTAVTCSRMLFVFFNDSEGPNLLIVTVLALVVYLLSTAAYLFGPFKMIGIRRLLVTICIQMLLVIGLYFCMNG